MSSPSDPVSLAGAKILAKGGQPLASILSGTLRPQSPRSRAPFARPPSCDIGIDELMKRPEPLADVVVELRDGRRFDARYHDTTSPLPGKGIPPARTGMIEALNWPPR